MEISILCNGGKKVGLGHIARTMAIAKELEKKENVKVTYISDRNKYFKEGIDVIKKNNFDFIYYDEYLHSDVIIIDRYDVDEQYFKAIRKKSNKIIYIDDLHRLNYYDVDMIINRNIGAENIKYNAKSGCKMLLGTKYCILKESFRKSKAITIREKVKKILITFGGSDVTNTTPLIVKYLCKSDYELLVVIGDAFSDENKAEIEDIALKNKNVKLFYSPDMAELMSKCDMAVTACGGTVFELAALGIPSIAVIVADNQEEGAYKGSEYSLFNLYGWYYDLEKENFLKEVKKMADNFYLRKKLSASQKNQVYLNGVYNIINNILIF